MKTLCQMLFIFCFIIMQNNLKASDPLDAIFQKNLNNSTNGIAVAFAFVARNIDKESKNFLYIYIKNTSNSVKEFDPDSITGGVELSDSENGSPWRPLRSLDPRYRTRATLSYLEPGKAVVYTIELNANEVSSIQSRFVRLNARFDIGKNNSFKMETPPRQMEKSNVD